MNGFVLCGRRRSMEASLRLSPVALLLAACSAPAEGPSPIDGGSPDAGAKRLESPTPLYVTNDCKSTQDLRAAGQHLYFACRRHSTGSVDLVRVPKPDVDLAHGVGNPLDPGRIVVVGSIPAAGGGAWEFSENGALIARGSFVEWLPIDGIAPQSVNADLSGLPNAMALGDGFAFLALGPLLERVDLLVPTESPERVAVGFHSLPRVYHFRGPMRFDGGRLTFLGINDPRGSTQDLYDIPLPQPNFYYAYPDPQGAPINPVNTTTIPPPLVTIRSMPNEPRLVADVVIEGSDALVIATNKYPAGAKRKVSLERVSRTSRLTSLVDEFEFAFDDAVPIPERRVASSGGMTVWIAHGDLRIGNNGRIRYQQNAGATRDLAVGRNVASNAFGITIDDDYVYWLERGAAGLDDASVGGETTSIIVVSRPR